MKVLIILLALATSGCAYKTAPKQISEPKHTLEHSVQAIKTNKLLEISHQHIFDLPQAERFKVLEHMQRKPENKTAYDHLYKYLESKLANFNYYGNTLTAAESIYKKGGNCLSLAILTSAYAQLVDIEYGFDLISSSPLYLRQDGLDLISNHVRTKLFASQAETEQQLLSLRGGIIVDYFPARRTHIKKNIDHDYFISLYYQNLASEAIANNHYEAALAIAKQGVLISPQNLNLLNTLAVSLSRLKRYDEAESIYQQGLNVAPDNLDILINYRILAKNIKDNETVNRITTRINNSNDPTPFAWLNLADEAFHNKDYQLAIKYYKQAAKFAPYLRNAYQGLGRSYLKLNNAGKAKNAFETALKLTHDDNLEEMYQTKITKLQVYLNKNNTHY
ncbi:tetratricopeptide repeat protein [Pseudoalteromonas piratica]|uniref:Uncharacterized protein n=1 Tax=Pseudoalteromonas piratica TaxID=1348114 RepID=A0A0A7ECH0_9GAMM|nr:tetratricopeptide repeat protein [Pseudoalteromonas piratica]AIY63732.1 hypothetical protein OM33_00055 [Pseudoalteromonas piratica]